MRIRGRRLYPGSLVERRLLMSLGGVPLYTPRGMSPYVIARRLTRAAAGEGPDVQFVREALAKRSEKRQIGSTATVLAGGSLDTEELRAQDSVAA